jgi:hypothetical protein
MKRFLILCAVALTLGGCASLGSIGEHVLNLPAGALTTTIKNPVAPVNIYQAKVVYASTLEIANGYREYCYSKPYAALMADPAGRVCQKRRAIVTAMQAADDKAFAALKTADTFVKNNPTLDASSAIHAAIAAVTNFQSIAAANAKNLIK